MKTWKCLESGLHGLILLVAVTGTAFAAAGKLQIGSAGIVVLDEGKVEPGAEYTADGAKIPAVVVYVDAAGKTHDYLPVEMLPDLLNVDVFWSETGNSVVLGPTIEGIAGFDPSTYSPEEDPILKENPTSPIKGAVKGPFMEIAPKTVKTSEKPVMIAEDKTKVQSVTGFSSGGCFNPELGKYI